MEQPSRIQSALLVIALLALGAPARAADSRMDGIVGNWLTSDRSGIIRITAQPDGTFEGSIAGGNAPGRVDARNPNEALRRRSLLGAVLLRGLRQDGDGRWSGGTIYDPNSGRTYHCTAQLVAPDELKLRGYVGFPLLGRNEAWTRYRGTDLLPPSAR